MLTFEISNSLEDLEIHGDELGLQQLIDILARLLKNTPTTGGLEQVVYCCSPSLNHPSQFDVSNTAPSVPIRR